MLKRPFFVYRCFPIYLALLGVGIFFAVPAHAATGGTLFFIDSSYDDSGRDSATATDIFDGNHAHFYVENSFIASLSSVGQQQLLSYTQKLSQNFDHTIYPNETYVFGNEWKPGIDNDLKLYVLITPMKNSAGGYFRPQDEQVVEGSNEKEILYLNAHLIALPHAQEFLAHEFQHLINYNQKTRLRGMQDDVWLNEMMSETAAMIDGVYKEPDFSYQTSNVHDRVTTFLDSPDDDVLDWNESVQDYASISLLGYYLYEHYGPQFFTDLEQTDKTGIPALDQALQEVGSQKTFEQVFSDWTVALILNDCSAAPQNLYCYTDSFLNYDNVHIQFRKTQISKSEVSFKQQTDEWAGNWFRYQQPSSDTQVSGTLPEPASTPSATYLNFSFSASADSTKFLGFYVVYGNDGTTRIDPVPFAQDAASWSVPDFGTNVKQVDVVFGDFFHKQMTLNNPFLTPYTLDATLATQPIAPTSVQPSLTTATAASLRDGDLLRIIGDSKVYIIQGGYKRWIQNAAIFNSYGNLHWDLIRDVSADTAAHYKDSSLVELPGDPRVFREYANGTKRWIATKKAFLDNGYSWDSIFTINKKEFNLFFEGDAITF